MKKILFLFLCFPLTVFSQNDSLKRRMIGFEVVVPFEPGLSYYFQNTTSSLPDHAEILMNNHKNIGTRVQFLSAQFHFNDLISIEYAFTLDNIGFQSKDAFHEFQRAYPGYYLQEESKYANGTDGNGQGGYSLSYSKASLGVNIFRKGRDYLQPFISYCFGKGTLPDCKYSFKENASNELHINTYDFGKLKSEGFAVGINFKKYMDSDDPNLGYVGYYGIKLEYAHMNVFGEATIERSVLIGSSNTTQFNVKKKSNFMAVSVFLGLASKRDKRFLSDLKTTH